MRILITGVSSPTGRLLAARLAASYAPGTVVGLDHRALYPTVPGLTFVRADVRRREWQALLVDTDVVVACGGLDWPSGRRADEARWVEASRALLRAISAPGDNGSARVHKVVLALSAALYGVPHQPGVSLHEHDPVRGHQFSRYARARALVSDYAGWWAATWPGVYTELRVGWIAGATHRGLVRVVERGPILACGMEQRPLSVVHEDDVIAAIAHAIERDIPGTYNIAAAQPATTGALAAWLERDEGCTALPWLVLRAWWDWRLRGRPAPPGWLRDLLRGAALDVSRLQATGWQPQHAPRAALAAALAAARERPR